MNILTILTVALCYGIWERSPWVRPRTLGRDLESLGFKAGFAIFVHVCNSGTRRLKSLFFCFRSRLAIIPQDAFLFSGAVRDNLDPWKRVSGVCIHCYCYSRERSLCLRSTLGDCILFASLLSGCCVMQAPSWTGWLLASISWEALIPLSKCGLKG